MLSPVMVDELAETREMLDSRYDDHQKRQGEAHPGDGEHFRKSAETRR